MTRQVDALEVIADLLAFVIFMGGTKHLPESYSKYRKKYKKVRKK